MFKRGFLKNNAFIFNALSHFLDPLVIAGTSLLLVYGPLRDQVDHQALIKALALYGPLFVLLIFPLFRMYRIWRGERLFTELASLFWAWLAVLLAINSFILLLANEQQRQILWPYGLFQEQIFFFWALFCFLAMGAARMLTRFFLRIMRRLGYNQRTAVIVGAGPVGLDLATKLNENDWTGIRIAGFFADGDHQAAAQESLPVLGGVKDCVAFCANTRPDMVIIALSLREEETISHLVRALGTTGTAVFMVPDMLAYGLQKAKMQQLGEVSVLAFNLFPTWKRVFDVAFSSLVLLLLSPLFLVIALLIKLSDGGPVFYSHRRIGETGEPFGCLKFRTMYTDAEEKLREILTRDPVARQEWEKSYKLKKDPRVTFIGRFLRRSSLDELPQFLNVLRGEMSVVGARPIVDTELARFYQETAVTYCAMKPGITGPWQVGKRNDVEDYRERVDLDCWYVRNASFWLDLSIILKTAGKVLFGKGAY